MANDYFDSGSYTPAARLTKARAETVNAIATALVAAFDKLPTLLGLRQDRVTYVADTGAADAYVVTLSPVLPSYTAGLRISMKATNANTGASTLNVNSLGTKSIKRYDGSALQANDIVAGMFCDLRYDGTNFQLTNAAGVATAAAASATAAAASASSAATSASASASSASSASTSATAAAASAAAAAVSAAAAALSASSVGLPSGVGDTMLVRATDNSAYETKTASQVRTFLSLVVGTNVQAYHAILAALAGLSPAADKLAYFTGASAQALTDLTSYGRSLIAVADEAALKALVNLEIGTDVLAPSGSGAALTGIHKQGLQTLWVPSNAMYPQTTNGCAAIASVDSGSENLEYKVLDFDTSTQEFAQFAVRFPKSWNQGTVTFAPYWTAASGSDGVVWALQGVALSNDDALNTAFGTEQTSTDTLITAGDVHIGPTSAAITIAGTPAAGDEVFFRVKRVPADGSDTLAVDARLLGLVIFFTTNAADDT